MYLHANQEILCVCLRFVDLTVSRKPHIRECLINVLKLGRANASTISQNISEPLTNTSVLLDVTNKEDRIMMELLLCVLDTG